MGILNPTNLVGSIKKPSVLVKINISLFVN